MNKLISTNLLLTTIIGYLLITLKDLPYKLFNIIKTQLISSITVTSQNKLVYRKLNEYLYSLNKHSIKNNIEVEQFYSKNKDISSPGINYGIYFIKISRLTYCIIQKELKDTTYDISSVITLSIFGFKRKNITKEIKKKISKFDDEKKIKIYCSLDPYDDGMYMPKKSFDSIFLKAKKKEKIIRDLNVWSNNEKLYIEKGIIYKLGILLYGEPGTGKTSIARAIASYLSYDIYMINLKGYKNYRELMNKLLSIQEKSIILFEDIDCIIKNRDKENNENEEILNIALNFIDGIYSPNNCIIIATTNYISKLDNAFTREGRFDLKLEIDNLSINEADKMCESYGTNLKNILPNIKENEEINPSFLQNKLLIYKNKLLQ